VVRMPNANAKVPFCISAAVFLLFAFGHTLGFLLFQPPSQQGRAVLEQMRSVSFNFSGRTTTWWTLYEGFGLSIAIALILSALLSWRLSRSTTDPSLARTLAWLLCAAQLGNSVICLAFFGLVQTAFALASATALAWSAVSLRRDPSTTGYGLSAGREA